jgi:hypothetical protein
MWGLSLKADTYGDIVGHGNTNLTNDKQIREINVHGCTIP